MSLNTQKNKQKKTLSVQRFNRLESIFTTKHWSVYSEFEYNYFEHFCERLSEFSDEQQDLILDLTEEFLDS